MAGRIAGITVRIGGDTSGLTKALKGVDGEIRQTQSKLRDVEKLLKLNPTSTELLRQKQQALGSQIDATKQKLKTLKAASEQAAGSAKNWEKYQEAVKPIQNEISETEKKLEKLREEKKKADQAFAAGKMSKADYDRIQSEVTETEQKLKALKAQQKQAYEEFGKPLSPKQYDALQREIIDTETKLKSLEKEARTSQITLQKMAAVGEKMKSIGSAVSGVGKSISTYVTLPLAAAGTAGVKSFAEVDKTMQLTNKTMGSSKKEAALLSRAMKSAAANSTYGMQDAATATLNFARAGLKAKDAAAVLAPSMNLAAGEGGNLDTVSSGLVATLNGFAAPFTDAKKYADVFAAGCNNSALQIDTLSDSMSIAAPIFKTAGYSVEDAVTALGMLGNKGIEANVAATSLKTGLARLVSPAKEGAEAMKEIGFSITRADGTMKPFTQVQAELNQKFSKMSESEQMAAASAIFGKNQMSAWLALINTAPDDVQTLSDSLHQASGTTDEMANAMMSGFGGSIEKLKSSIDVMTASLGEALAPTILKVADVVQSLVDKFNALTPAQQQTIAKIGLLVAAVGPLLVVTGKLVWSVGTILTAAPQIAGALSQISGAMKGAGVGLKSFVGIGLVLGGAAAAVKNFVSMFQNGFSVIKSCLMGIGIAVAAVGAVLLGAPAAVAAIIAAIVFAVANLAVVIKQHWTGISEFLTNTWSSIKSAASTIWNGIASFFTTIWSGVTSAVTGAWKGISSSLIRLWNGIKSAAGSVWNAVKNVILTPVYFVTGAVVLAWQKVKGPVTVVWNALRSAASTVWNGIKAVIVNPVKSAVSTTAAAFQSLKAKVSAVFSAIRLKASSAWNSVKTVMGNAARTGVAAVKSAFSKLSGIASSAFNKCASAIRSAGGKIKSICSSLASGAVNTLKSHFAGAASIGANLITGLWNGISSKVGWIISQVGSIGSKIVAAGKKALGVHSPSVIFYQIGKNVSLGLANGISKNARLSEAAVQKMADKMLTTSKDYQKKANKLRSQAESARKKRETQLKRAEKLARNAKKRADRAEALAEAKKLKRERSNALAEAKILDKKAKKYKETSEKLKALIEQQTALQEFLEVVFPKKELGEAESKAAAFLNTLDTKTRKAVKKLCVTVDGTSYSLQGLSKELDLQNEKLEEAKAQLESAKQAYQDYADSVKSSFTDMGKLSDYWNSQDDDHPAIRSIDDFLIYLEKRTEDAQGFADQLSQLADMGLDQSILDDIRAQGLETGSAFASALLTGADPTKIAELNRLEKKLASIGETMGKKLSDKFYKAGVDSAQALVDGIKSKIAEIQAAITELTDAAAQQAKLSLNLGSAGSGSKGSSGKKATTNIKKAVTGAASKAVKAVSGAKKVSGKVSKSVSNKSTLSSISSAITKSVAQAVKGAVSSTVIQNDNRVTINQPVKTPAETARAIRIQQTYGLASMRTK